MQQPRRRAETGMVMSWDRSQSASRGQARSHTPTCRGAGCRPRPAAAPMFLCGRRGRGEQPGTGLQWGPEVQPCPVPELMHARGGVLWHLGARHGPNNMGAPSLHRKGPRQRSPQHTVDCLSSILFFFFSNVYSFLRKRERESMSRGGAD